VTVNAIELDIKKVDQLQQLGFRNVSVMSRHVGHDRDEKLR
jgi:hypothetical protein